MTLVESLIKDGWLKTPRIISAFRTIQRADFMTPEFKNLSEMNEAFPIGFGQTISQPLTVAFMLELLQPEPGDKILDIGSGSGWTSALLAHIVSKSQNLKVPEAIPSGCYGASKSQNNKSKSKIGKVIAIEVIPELMEFGKRNVSKYNFVEKGITEFVLADGSKGYQKEAPYDKILVSAAAEKCFETWKNQLKIGGRIVTPIGSSIWLFVKKSFHQFDSKEFPGFAFVPLVH